MEELQFTALIAKSFTVEWIALGGALIIIEIFTPAFGFVFVGAGAFAAAACSAMGLNLVYQLGAFLVVLLVSFIFLRPRIVQALSSKTKDMDSNRAQALIGKIGVVTEEIDLVLSTGRILILGEDWAAESDSKISPDTEVEVTGTNGIKLKVKNRNQ